MRGRPRGDLSVRKVGDEAVVLDRAAERVHQLNATAAFIWFRLADGESQEQIADALAASYAVDVSAARADVARVVAELDGLGLLDPGAGSAADESKADGES